MRGLLLLERLFRAIDAGEVALVRHRLARTGVIGGRIDVIAIGRIRLGPASADRPVRWRGESTVQDLFGSGRIQFRIVNSEMDSGSQLEGSSASSGAASWLNCEVASGRLTP